MKKKIKYIIILLTGLLINACANSREEAIPVIAEFSATVVDQDYSVPVKVFITNFSEGADTYVWNFEGGFPVTSTLKNPGTIVYSEAGNYTISLEVSNQDGSVDTSEITIPVDSEIIIDFSTEILVDNFPPVEVELTNNTSGANEFNWTFENGTPESSLVENPENVIFDTPGTHTITLEVSNGLETYQQEKTIYVAPNLEAIFEYETTFEDDDYQAPVTIELTNNSISATDYSWSFEGGNITTSSDESPTVTFTEAGTYTIVLEATNGKETESTSTTITVLEDTNLRTFENIQLGINSAHNGTIGAFFSTTTREVYHKDAVTEENGVLIDIVFYGLDQTFGFNKFVSPDEVTTLTTFEAIPDATATKFINVQENCNCDASLTVAEFDAMENDTLLEQLTITETEEGLADFDDTVVPRIILFETEDGRKGGIKINNFIEDGINSYINIDIKVQKK